MSRPSLAELRNRLKDRDTQKPKFSKDLWPFWNMAYDQEAHIRILNDANEENYFQFYVEKRIHKLPIAGKQQTIACTRMYGEDCPICDRSSKFYKAEGKGSQRGKLYYVDKSFIMKALVLKDPLPEDADGNFTGKVSTLQLNRQLFERINADLGTLDDNDKPFELKNGINFVIRKTKKSTPTGDLADYTSSSFARRPSDIPDEIASTISLVDLSTLLPKNPGLEKVLAFLEAHDRGVDLPDESNEERAPTASVATPSVVDSKEEAFDSDDKIPYDTPAKVEESVELASEEKASVVATDEDDDDLINAILNRNKTKK